MVNFWSIVNKTIKECGILLLVLDSRMPEFTRNIEIEQKITLYKKKLIYVINKCDLIDPNISKELKKKYKPSVFVSGTKHYGTNYLREKILATSKGEPVVVGVLGYPNVGKSSVINMLKGRGSAKVSSISGYTKAMQRIQVGNKITLIDTPGVIPYNDKDEIKKVLIGSIDFDKIKDPEYIALELIEKYPNMIQKAYGVENVNEKDADKILEEIAIKKKRISKGNKPDIFLISRMIIQDWQKGKLFKFR